MLFIHRINTVESMQLTFVRQDLLLLNLFDFTNKNVFKCFARATTHPPTRCLYGVELYNW